MAGRSGRAGVSRGEEGRGGGKSADGVRADDKAACGESFLILPVRVPVMNEMHEVSRCLSTWFCAVVA